ncbi:hypothetical protein A1Q1_06075 [Trichosporon asahii var. asahii CBS 2479]|uniref:Uncharacterized protein n=1 Tax=Trichosporon asahii var. asahii (strain ATCC 90039 / CBS 2479 / JCM 2466 / KCTC 7840 / NBRC 103889/ NCYC 2677 / UAMH 7654) TaxID=1186058 RepID=J6EMB8_TRIAS|nr:hypothetical protein A1Q1_06075 [Trichosporon asahii var. asahii CBS 2479]EJT45459.1 hypothetical protein A1Q1_06075 [Trichosporon asahii var. asahii CBS 2479]
MLALTVRVSARPFTRSWIRLMSSNQTDSQADVAADRAASDFPARPNAEMQADTVKFLKVEDQLRSNPPKDAEQAAADFAKLQEVGTTSWLWLTSRPRSPSRLEENGYE